VVSVQVAEQFVDGVGENLKVFPQGHVALEQLLIPLVDQLLEQAIFAKIPHDLFSVNMQLARIIVGVALVQHDVMDSNEILGLAFVGTS